MDTRSEIIERMRRVLEHAGEWWARQSTTARWSAVGVVLGVLLGVVIAFALAGGDDEGPAVVVTPVLPTPVVATPAATAAPTATASPTTTATAPPTATATAAPTADAGSTPTPTATATPTPTATATPPETATAAPGIPTYGTLEALRGAVGEAPDATLGRIRIPVLGVDAALGQRLVSGSRMQNPTGPSDVVWYDLSLWDGLGGAPGGGSNAVFSGHVDYFLQIPWAEVIYRGNGVFRHLSLLAPGDVIEVEIGGQTLRYSVVWQRQIAADSNSREILSSDVGVDSITLITCGGEFDVASKTYDERVIIRAERIPT